MLSNCGPGEDSWESLVKQGDQTSQGDQSKLKVNQPWILWYWSWSSNTLATWWKSWLIGKDPDAGKDQSHEMKRVTEDEMVGWHHFIGHELGQIPRDGEG